MENVSISNIRIDTSVCAGNWWGNGEAIFIMATRHHYDKYALAAPQRSLPVNVRGVRVHSAACFAENAIGIVGASKNICDY